MFRLFKKKSEFEKLQDQYKKLMEKSYRISAINRSESDTIIAKAEEIIREMEALK